MHLYHISNQELPEEFHLIMESKNGYGKKTLKIPAPWCSKSLFCYLLNVLVHILKFVKSKTFGKFLKMTKKWDLLSSVCEKYRNKILVFVIITLVIQDLPLYFF